MMTIYIVRHGETEENLQRILQGHMPGTLTEMGKEQVRKTAELLAKEGVKYTKLVSSDLKRAMDSAQIISDKLNLPIIPMEIFRERDWGKFTGMSIAEAAVYVMVKRNFCLRDESRGMTTDQIADAINRQRLHIRKDGKPVTSAQVYAVICRFPEMFTKAAGRRLRACSPEHQNKINNERRMLMI